MLTTLNSPLNATLNYWMQIFCANVQTVCVTLMFNVKIQFELQTKSLQHLSSNLCLDVPPEDSQENGLILNTCNGYPSQQWELESVPWN